METFSALLVFCAGNSPVAGEFLAQRPVAWALMLSLICAWINSWINNRKAGDVKRHRAYYDVSVMKSNDITATSFDKLAVISLAAIKWYISAWKQIKLFFVCMYYWWCVQFLKIEYQLIKQRSMTLYGVSRPQWFNGYHWSWTVLWKWTHLP